jgi:hypothetical protein
MHVVLISWIGPYRGVVKYQAIILVYVLLNLVKRQSIKYPWNVALSAVFLDKMKKKMNNNQNNVVLVKFNLILWFVIFLNYTPDWLQIFNFVQFCPYQTSTSPLKFDTFFFLSLVSDLCNLTLNWPLNSQFSSISPLISINWVPKIRHILQNSHWLWISLI